MARVLVIDDDPDILKLLRLCLEEDHEVVSTDQPQTALGLVRETRPAAIVLDVMMPEVTGWDVLASIREDPELREIPVIMLSALGEVEHRVRGIRLGADDYLAKPFDPEELVARVEGIIARRSSSIAGLQGDLKAHPFPELVQSLAVAGKSGGLKITTHGGKARIDLVEGRIVRARFGSLEGEKAFLALVELEDGSFTFTREEVSSSRSEEKNWSFRTEALLLKAAWLEDELRELAPLLPGLEETLEVSDSSPNLSDIAADLPVESILDRIRTAPVSLRTLLEESPFSPNQIRLSVAWLRKLEGISVKKNQTSTEVLDSAIQTFVQETASQGSPGDDVRLGILVAPGAWSRLAPLILSLPDESLGADGRLEKRQVLLQQGGVLRLHHGGGTLALEFLSLELAVDSTLSFEPGPAGIVVWAESELRPAWVRFVAGRVVDSTRVLLVASPALILAADGFPEGSKSWRWLTPAPDALPKVLKGLSEAKK